MTEKTDSCQQVEEATFSPNQDEYLIDAQNLEILDRQHLSSENDPERYGSSQNEADNPDFYYGLVCDEQRGVPAMADEG